MSSRKKPVTLEEVGRDVDHVLNRFRDREDSANREKYKATEMAKLLVMNSRDCQELKGKRQAVAFVSGELRTK